MKTFIFVFLLFVCCSLRAEREFFAFDNGVTSIKSVEEQADLLKKLGYDGICTRPANCTDELLGAFDRHGVAITASYVVLKIGAENDGVPESIISHFRKLKGRKTIIWLSLNNREATMEAAVELTRSVCDRAAECDLDVVLYPHVGCFTERIPTCMQILKLAERKNLGLSFTLCHFLALNPHQDLENMLKRMGSELKVVLINGANELTVPKADWKELIQPLGQGTLDIGRVIRSLNEIGYDGPVGLQCYKVPGPPQDHLKMSMDAWKRINR